jgi:hypothetical protein
MQIDKSYFTLPEILDRWQIAEADLIYLAENDELRLSVRVFGLPVVFADAEATAMRAALQVPLAQTRYDGLLDLHARDVFQLFRCGELHVSAFRTPRAGCAALHGEAKPVLVLIGDLLLRRDERDRFEIATGFSSGEPAMEESTFIASVDYQEVRCNGHRFRLGPIQADVVRALHAAAQADAPWQNGKTMLAAAGSRSLKMSDVFKSQKHWRQLIRSNRRGGYRLNVV